MHVRPLCSLDLPMSSPFEMEADARPGLSRSLSDGDGDITLSLDKFVDAASPSFVRRAILPLALGNAADAVEILSAGYILSAFRQEDGSALTSTQKEFLTAAVFVGMLIGGLIAGSTADRLGRRSCLLVSLSVNFTFAVASAAAPSVGWLIAARVFAGLGVGGSIPVVFVLGAELFPTRSRGVVISIIASFWMIGAIFAGAAAWVVLGNDFGGDRILAGGTWRHYALIAALPVFAALLMSILFVPESPRYLAKTGQYVKMAAVLRGMTNSPVFFPPDLVERQPVSRTGQTVATRSCFWGRHLRQGQQHRLLGGGDKPSDARDDRSSAGDESDEGSDLSDGSRPGKPFHGGMMQIICPGDDSSLRRSTAVLIAVFFTLSYGTYGIATWNTELFSDIGLSNPYLCSFIFALSNLPGNVASILLVERVGRKHLLSASMALAAAAATLFALGSESGAGVVVSGACLFNAFSTCGWNVLGVISVEAFPTEARVSGVGLVTAVGRLGSIAAQFVNGSLEDNVLLLLMVTSGLTLLGGAASLLLPRDKRGVSLDALPARTAL